VDTASTVNCCRDGEMTGCDAAACIMSLLRRNELITDNVPPAAGPGRLRPDGLSCRGNSLVSRYLASIPASLNTPQHDNVCRCDHSKHDDNDS